MICRWLLKRTANNVCRKAKPAPNWFRHFDFISCCLARCAWEFFSFSPSKPALQQEDNLVTLTLVAAHAGLNPPLQRQSSKLSRPPLFNRCRAGKTFAWIGDVNLLPLSRSNNQHDGRPKITAAAGHMLGAENRHCLNQVITWAALWGIVANPRSKCFRKRNFRPPRG